MDIAGVNKETEFGFGGEIIKDLSRKPTGVFNERAQGLISEKVENNLGEESDLRAIELAVKPSLENEVTSFHDAKEERLKSKRGYQQRHFKSSNLCNAYKQRHNAFKRMV